MEVETSSGCVDVSMCLKCVRQVELNCCEINYSIFIEKYKVKTQKKKKKVDQKTCAKHKMSWR